jgi:hypothetical protein
MESSTVISLLGWSSIINLGILIYWFLMILFARQWVYRLHGRWFQLTESQLDVIHYAGMGLYKLMILFFNLIPWLLLRYLL